MVKKIVFVFLIFLFAKTYGQKCKTDKDPFTNEEIISFDFDNRTVYFEIKNDKITFDVVFNYWGEREHEFNKGTEIWIKLENGYMIDLKTSNSSKPKIESITSSSGFFPAFGGGMTTSSSSNFTAYSFTFLLSKSELKKLAESDIEIIRIPDTDEEKYVDLEAKGRTKKKTRAIKKGAACMSENI